MSKRVRCPRCGRFMHLHRASVLEGVLTLDWLCKRDRERVTHEYAK